MTSDRNGLRSPRAGDYVPGFNRNVTAQMAASNPPLASSAAERPTSTRRFTTNGVVPGLSAYTQLSPIGVQRRQAAEATSDPHTIVSLLLAVRTLALQISLALCSIPLVWIWLCLLCF